MNMNNTYISISGLALIIIAMIIAYLPGRELFFRSCEWEETFLIEKSRHSLKSLLYFISGTTACFTKHFFPIGYVFVALRYSLFRNRYNFHLYCSLLFHIVNVVLVYFVALTISSNHKAALMSSVLFAFTAIIADTILWVIMFPNIVCMTAIFTSILTHPELINDNVVTNILFYASLFLVPMFYETGLVAPIIAVLICLLKNNYDPVFILVLFMPIAIYFIGRRLVNGTFGVFSKAGGSKNGALCFLGIKLSIKHIFMAMLKVILSFFQCKFKIKILETMFMFKPNFKSPLTILSFGLTCYMLFSVFGVVISEDISTVTKLIMIIFPTVTFMHFFMLSFNIQPWYRDYDPIRQADTTPWYMYSPSAFMSIPVGYVIIANQKNMTFLVVCSFFIVVNGIYSIREQIKMLRPCTDSMKESLKFFKKNGCLPYRGRRYLMEHYRLDGMFRNDMVLGILRFGDKNLKVPKVEGIKSLEIYNVYFDIIDLIWDFYNIVRILNEYSCIENSKCDLNSIKLELHEQLLKCAISYKGLNADEIVNTFDINYIKENILVPYIRMMLTKIHPRSFNSNYQRDDRDLNDKELINRYLPGYVECNILIPALQRVLMECKKGVKNLNSNEIINTFYERDKELSIYVKTLLEKSINIFSELHGKSVIVWGTGEQYKVVEKILSQLKIEAFIENDPLEHGKCINSVPIKPPSYLYNTDLPFFICSLSKEQIYHQIEKECSRIIKNIEHCIPVL